jgi:hydroxymethylglutaryl-CoA reductase
MKSTKSKELGIVDFQLEGQLSSDKKLSWESVHSPRGVQVLAWGKFSNEAHQEVLGCTGARFHQVISRINEGGVRNGQMGQNVNTANVMATIFLACGQDVASVLKCGWSQLTTELDGDSQELTLSLYIPSVAVGTVGGGTQYPTQREALELIGCSGPGKKHALAETVAAFALALEVSTLGALANDTFAQSHKDLARAAPPIEEACTAEGIVEKFHCHRYHGISLGLAGVVDVRIQSCVISTYAIKAIPFHSFELEK